MKKPTLSKAQEIQTMLEGKVLMFWMDKEE